MFNGSRFNGVAFNAGSGGVRVLLASAVLAASATGSAEPLRTHHGKIDAPVTATIQKPRAIADRAGEAIGYPSATFEPGRPWDLAGSSLLGSSRLEPDHLVTRAGVSLLDGNSFFSAEAIRYAFFSSMSADAVFDPLHALAFRYGVADVDITASGEINATREHPGRSSLAVRATASADADIYAGGITRFDPYVELFAEAHLNGVQPGYTSIDVLSSLEVNETRVAGAAVDGLVTSAFTAKALPGRGATVDAGYVTATLSASWWAYNYEEGEFNASSELSLTPHIIAAGRADMEVKAPARAQWSLIIEPKQIMSVSSATLESTPWRIRHFAADARVFSYMKAVPFRILSLDVAIDGTARLTRARLSVNLTDPAPEQRQMPIPAGDRGMVVTYEDRTMVVT